VWRGAESQRSGAITNYELCELRPFKRLSGGPLGKSDAAEFSAG